MQTTMPDLAPTPPAANANANANAGANAGASVDAAAPVVVEEHDASGFVVARTTLVDGLPHGRMERFGAGGVLLLEADYEHGQLAGTLRTYAADGTPELVALYADGVQHGLAISYQGGRVAGRQHYMHGQLDGESVFVAPSGQLSARYVYRQGMLEEEAVFAHEGVVVSRARYRAGKREGETREFDARGLLVQSMPYRDGLPHGVARRFGPEGDLVAERRYAEGKPQGEWEDVSATVAEPGADAGSARPSGRFERWVRG